MEIERVKERILESRPGFTRQYGPQRSDHQPGIPFWPQESARDFVTIFLLTALMFVVTGAVVPALGPARSPQLSELIVPDWYLLFSWGYLKLGDVFPSFILFQGTPLETQFNAVFWGDILSGIPVIALLILPFVDRGREARPAKSPIRSAVGVGGIVTIFTASLYAIREVIEQTWKAPDKLTILLPDDTLKWFILFPAVFAGVATYVALLRLGYRPMRKWLVGTTAGAFAIVLVQSAVLLFVPGQITAAASPYVVEIAIYLGILAVATGGVAAAVFLLPEAKARRAVHWIGIVTALGFFGYWWYQMTTDFPGYLWTMSVIEPSMNTTIFPAIFGVMCGWFGLRRPYSSYEYLLNECYQCGKCHTVCPVTKVEDDALGGLNLVYNTFKKQHDGVPLWTCLACDACSAVCPLDIQYSDYIKEERAKVHARVAADGGEPTWR
jgi:ferredoxin